MRDRDHFTVSFNINESVLVKFNEDSLRVYRDFYSRQRLLPERKSPADKDGYAMFQLWEVMQIFGPAFVFGKSPPIETRVLLDPADLESPPSPDDGWIPADQPPANGISVIVQRENAEIVVAYHSRLSLKHSSHWLHVGTERPIVDAAYWRPLPAARATT